MTGFSGPAAGGVPIEFLLFGTLLLAIAFVHWNTTVMALIGAAVITAYKLTLSAFAEGPGGAGLFAHATHEWVLLANLLGLLLGFALLARHVEASGLPELLPNHLPDGALGGFLLLAAVFVLSAVLDNIAAAIIGAAIARVIFRGRIHVGFLASLVACANAGGVGSVLGDTTTTMMWIAGVGPLQVLPGYVAAGGALLVTAIPASRQQHAFSPIVAQAPAGLRLGAPRLLIVAGILCLVVLTNLLINLSMRQHADAFPFLAVALWTGILLTAPLRRPDWAELPNALQGAIFLLALVWCASMMPVDQLPAASWLNTLALGYLSALLDNIPLTALALKQGGYDWGMLAYAAGFGGSMLWFGSSAGVAVANRYPEAKSVRQWLRHGWHVVLAYPIGFAVMLALVGWHPEQRQRPAPEAAAAQDRRDPGSGLKMQGGLGLKSPPAPGHMRPQAPFPHPGTDSSNNSSTVK
ncbi:MAG: citrate transporter [Herminiimonas sp.]|nr:citrate transporter [Herminiimonas sp.]